MDWNERVRSAFAGRPTPDDDVIEELAQHAADAWQAARADGLDPAEAARTVERQVQAWAADAAALRRTPRRPLAPPPPAPSTRRMAGLLQDVRYAVRVLRRQPGYTLAALVTMALGIGATTVIFSVLHAVLLKPLPWPGADRLVRVSETRQGGTNRMGTIFTNAAYLAWLDHPKTLEALAGYSSSPATLTGAGDPARIDVASVTASLFPLLGARAALGTLFSPAEERPGAERQVVLSDGLWRERLGGTAAAIGKTVQLDGQNYRVVAVMPRSFAFPDRHTRAWIPFFVQPVSDGTPGRSSISIFRAIGKLRPGVTPAQAAAEGTARARSGADLGLVVVAVFGSKGAADVAAVPFLEAETQEVRPALLVLLAAAALLLATATANVASLQLARASSRRREIAVRAAIGAHPRRLVRQFLVESSVVGLAGGAAGVALAASLHRALPRLLPANFPRVDDITLDLPVLAVAAALSIGTGILFGLLPAMQARRVNLVGSLAEDSLAPVGGGGRSQTARARAFIMAGQVAMACVLLLGALLLTRSFFALSSANRGYDPHNVLTASLPLPEPRYTGAARSAFVARLLGRLQAGPGVRAAAATTTLPLTARDMLGSFRMNSPSGDGTVTVQTAIRHVSPRYFAAMGVRVVEGRSFSDADTVTSQPVVIVNRAFARQYLKGRAVGQRIPSSFSSAGGEAEVVGVVDDVRQRNVTDPTQPELYMSYSQMKDGVVHDEPNIVVRTAGNPALLVPTLRALVRDQDPTLALDEIRTMEDRVSSSLARPRVYAVLVASFALFALLVAAVGLFGVLSYTVALRTREIGVRAALGARPADIVRLVVRQGLAMALGGLVLGLALSVALLKYLSTLLYGVAVYDAWSYTIVLGSVAVIATLACALPAARAARVDPLTALRS